MSWDLYLKEGQDLHCPGEMGDSWKSGAPYVDAFSTATNNCFMVAEHEVSKCQTCQPAAISCTVKEYGDCASDKPFEVDQQCWVTEERIGFSNDLTTFTVESLPATEQGFENNFCIENLECFDSDSTISEYMTPAGSQFSIDSLVVEGPDDVSLLQTSHRDDVADVFCSCLEVFLSSEPITVNTVKPSTSHTMGLYTPAKSSRTASSVSINLNEDTELFPESGEHGTLSFGANYMESKVQFYEQTATILDVSDQRVNFINTPSVLSMVSGHVPHADHLLGESYPDHIIEDGYHQFDNDSSLESGSTSMATPSGSSPCSSNCECSPILETTRFQTTGTDTSTTSISQLLSMSAGKNGFTGAEPGRQQTDKKPRLKLNGFPPWTWLKKAVRRQLQAICSRKRGKKAKQASKGPSRFLRPSEDSLGSGPLCEESLEDDAVDLFGLESPRRPKKAASGRPCLQIRGQGDEGVDDNISSDEFYMSKWNLKGMYQRFMSYAHNVWCRRS
ncbi:unnamed protein product [Ixodes pacificus]